MSSTRLPARLASAAIAAALSAAPAAAAVVSGSFAPGERLAPPAEAAPVQTSRAFVKLVTPLAGRAVAELPGSGGGGLLVWTVPSPARRAGPAALAAPSPASPVRSRLVTPGGETLEPGVERSGRAALRRFDLDAIGTEELGLDLPAGQELIQVAAAEPGTYRLELAAGSDDAAFLVVGAEPTSPLTLRTWAAPLSRRAGEPVSIHALLGDADAAVTDARVSARLAPASGLAAPVDLDLFDDGLHGDGAAGDGHYAASLAELPDADGGWSVRVDAEGTSLRGHPFARTGSSGFFNEPDLARLVPGSLAASFAGNGEGRRLRVTARADVREAGSYRLDVLVGGAAASDGSRPGVAWGQSTLELAPGPAELVLEIPAATLGAAAEGPLSVDARLLGLTRIGVAGRAMVDLVP